MSELKKETNLFPNISPNQYIGLGLGKGIESIFSSPTGLPLQLSKMMVDPSVKTANKSPSKPQVRKHFMKMVLDLSYYAAVVPYHIRYDLNSQDFIIHRNKFQMVFCILFQLLAIFSAINHILLLEMNQALVAQNPAIIFHLFRRITLLTTLLAWFRTIWSREKHLRKFVQLSYTALPGNCHKILYRLITTFCISYSMLSIQGCFIVGKMYYNFYDLFMAYLTRAQKTLHLCMSMDPPPPLSPWTVAPTIFQALLEHCHDLSCWVLYMVKSSMALVMWFRAKPFLHTVISHRPCGGNPDQHPRQIYEEYCGLKEMATCISSYLGLVLLAWIGYIVPFSAIKINDLFQTPDVLTGVFNMGFFTHVIMFFVLVSDSSAKIGCLKSWLIRDDIMPHFSAKKYNALLMELGSIPVAIQSSNGVFTFTYGFIGNIFMLMTSFFIIIIQFKTSPPAQAYPAPFQLD